MAKKKSLKRRPPSKNTPPPKSLGNRARKPNAEPASPKLTSEQRVWQYLEAKKIDQAIVYFGGGGDDGSAYKIVLKRGSKVVEELNPHVNSRLIDSADPPIEWLLQAPIFDHFVFEFEGTMQDAIEWRVKTRELYIPDSVFRL
jgi:hypothetical protein